MCICRHGDWPWHVALIKEVIILFDLKVLEASIFTSNYKVNRCLARYSPRATTTNRPTNRALNKPAWPGPN